ncbi:MAG: beta-propeller domain-containing protein [Halioglobus sp.]
MERYQLLPTALLICSVLLSGCGGGGGSSTPDVATPGPSEPQSPPVDPDPDPEPDPDPLEPKSEGLLAKAESEEALAAVLREGMRSNVAYNPQSLIDFSPAPPSSSPSIPEELPQFSTTNLQELGVDEADRVKYDGNILYIAGRELVEEPSNNPPSDVVVDDWFFSGNRPSYRPVITLSRTDADAATATDIARIELPPDQAQYELYVRQADTGKQLVGIVQDYAFPLFGFSDFTYWQSQFTRIVGWSVDDPDNISQQFSIEIEGALLASRRVGNRLYVVSRFTPQVPDLIYYPVTDEEREENDAVLSALSAAELLPRYSSDGETVQPLSSATDCLVPNEEFDQANRVAAGNAITTVTAIDLDAPETVQSTCLNAYINDFYFSLNSLYLTANLGSNATLIHKIALNAGDPLYRGSGVVPGYIGTTRPSFLMSEEGSDLRVLSTIRFNGGFSLPVMPGSESAPTPLSEEQGEEEVYYGDHQLTVLREDPLVDRLDRVARLPNDDFPAAIGKPGEQIFGARFLGDRAYVVTFRTVDPLYVLDLADPVDPKLAGELEIPGFSTLLQPLGDGLLLGVGRDADPNVGLIRGVKIALFDEADPTSPIELGSEIVGRRGSDSPTVNDHRTLALLPVDGGFRVALPIRRHDEFNGGLEGPFTSYRWSDSGLYQYDIDTASRTLTPAGKLVVGESDSVNQGAFVSLRGARGFINQDAVFFSVEGMDDVATGFWGTISSATQ